MIAKEQRTQVFFPSKMINTKINTLKGRGIDYLCQLNVDFGATFSIQIQKSLVRISAEHLIIEKKTATKYILIKSDKPIHI